LIATHSSRLAGRRALVTGAGTGIGREVALELAREGADIVLHYSHSSVGADSAADEIRQLGRRATVFKADFNGVDEVQALARYAIEVHGGIEILVNNAGITMNLPIADVTPEQFDTLYNVNVRAQFFLTQALVPSLIEAHGTIVNISSIHALEAYREHTVYAGTKGAIVSYSRVLAIELAPVGVRVNVVVPGATIVENHYKADPNTDPDAFGKCIPIGFAGAPIDIARAVAFLASDDSRYIVGQTLVVDGGTTSWMPFNDGFNPPMQGRFGKGYVPGL
jgi:NAD(P)-dependent dehydrogenase (short-subunit alcohol dehydrogenase family)